MNDPNGGPGHGRAMGQPGGQAAPPDLMTRVLLSVAASFGVDPAGLLAECSGALMLQRAFHRGFRVERSRVSAPSAAAMAFAVAMDKAVRHCLAERAAAGSPNDLPADLEIADTGVGADLQMAAASLQDDAITLDEAALLLGLRSAERVRQLAQAGLLEGWQTGGRRRFARLPGERSGVLREERRRW